MPPRVVELSTRTVISDGSRPASVVVVAWVVVVVATVVVVSGEAVVVTGSVVAVVAVEVAVVAWVVVVVTSLSSAEKTAWKRSTAPKTIAPQKTTFSAKIPSSRKNPP